MKSELGAVLHGFVCVVGVGNRHRGDDGAGPRVIDARRPGAGGAWFDAGTAPENLLEPIARTNPHTVLIVDAVAFGGLPGEWRLLDVSDTDAMVLSTHAGSLAMFGEYLSVRTAARVHLLGIQPESMGGQEGLSRAVEESVAEIAMLLTELLADDVQGNQIE